ncbi:MAG: general secretion pathway protein GspE [Planctomycetia bacterium]|nr:general secretion pathway protein GspE [Planctomycetia bacterium]
MAKQIDPYRDWLSIPDADRPLNHYQLLRLNKFEDDPARIRLHYRKMNAHVRKFATGDYAQQSQEVLNELAKAMLCLTDTRRKGEYDASLGREETSKRRKHTLEEILVGRKIIDMPQLEKARNLAKAIGLEIRDAVMQQKLAAPDAVMQAYAESLGLPYLDLGDVGVSEALAPNVPAVLARQHSCVPVMVDNGQLLMASPNPLIPEVEEELRLRIGMPVRTVLCTPSDINAAMAKYYPREVAAAQMAAGTASPAAAPAAGNANQPAAAAPPLSAEERAEQKKRQQFIAIVAGNFAFIGTVLFGFLAPKMAKSFGLGTNMKLYGAALMLAVVMAGVGWVAGGFVKR